MLADKGVAALGQMDHLTGQIFIEHHHGGGADAGHRAETHVGEDGAREVFFHFITTFLLYYTIFAVFCNRYPPKRQKKNRPSAERSVYPNRHNCTIQLTTKPANRTPMSAVFIQDFRNSLPSVK